MAAAGDHMVERHNHLEQHGQKPAVPTPPRTPGTPWGVSSLLQHVPARTGRRGQTDLAVYLTQLWLPTHAGSTPSNGRQVSSSTYAITQQGKTTWALHIRMLTKENRIAAEEQGFQQKGAVSPTEADIQQLLR